MSAPRPRNRASRSYSSSESYNLAQHLRRAHADLVELASRREDLLPRTVAALNVVGMELAAEMGSLTPVRKGRQLIIRGEDRAPA